MGSMSADVIDRLMFHRWLYLMGRYSQDDSLLWGRTEDDSPYVDECMTVGRGIEQKEYGGAW